MLPHVVIKGFLPTVLVVKKYRFLVLVVREGVKSS